MKTRFKLYLLTFLLFVAIFLLQKPLFMLSHLSAFQGSTFADWMKVMWHGLPLDMALAALLTVVPALLLLCTIWSRKKLWRRLARCYFALVAALLSWVFVRHLGFSSTVVAIVVGVVLFVVLFFLFWAVLLRSDSLEKKWLPLNPLLFSLLMLIITGALAVPASMWLSRPTVELTAFSDRQALNEAALNPLATLTSRFSFKPATNLKSSSFNPFKKLARKAAPQQEADPSLLPALLDPQVAGADTSAVAGAQHVDVLNSQRPNVLLVVPATMKGETLGDGGLRFRNIFATGNGSQLVSILSGCLAAEEDSVKGAAADGASLVGKLRAENYLTAFYSGQDLDATAQRGYLSQAGFMGIVGKTNFASTGAVVADADVVQTLLGELQREKTRRPWLRVVQLAADAAVEGLVAQLQKLPQWANTLVVVAPAKAAASDYRVPMVMTGGALKGPGNIDIYGSQADIAATILAQMGIHHGALIHSKDILNPASPHFAFYTAGNVVGMNTADNHYAIDLKADKVILDEGKAKGANAQKLKAYHGAAAQ